MVKGIVTFGMTATKHSVGQGTPSALAAGTAAWLARAFPGHRLLSWGRSSQTSQKKWEKSMEKWKRVFFSS